MSWFGRDSRRSMRPTAGVDGEFEALADVLSGDADVRGACHEIARRGAERGLALDEVLGGISRTTRQLGHGEPTFETARSAASAWSEAMLRFHHGLACEDPLSGLAPLAHLRSQLDGVYREAVRTGGSVPATRALVVVDVTARGRWTAGRRHRPDSGSRACREPASSPRRSSTNSPDGHGPSGEWGRDMPQ
jgi:hypothetical protein